MNLFTLALAEIINMSFMLYMLGLKAILVL